MKSNKLRYNLPVKIEESKYDWPEIRKENYPRPKTQEKISYRNLYIQNILFQR